MDEPFHPAADPAGDLHQNVLDPQFQSAAARLGGQGMTVGGIVLAAERLKLFEPFEEVAGRAAEFFVALKQGLVSLKHREVGSAIAGGEVIKSAL